MASKEKKSFALRLDAEMMDVIERWANDEYRSTNGQIEWMLAHMIKSYDRENRTTLKL